MWRSELGTKKEDPERGRPTLWRAAACSLAHFLRVVHPRDCTVLPETAPWSLQVPHNPENNSYGPFRLLPCFCLPLGWQEREVRSLWVAEILDLWFPLVLALALKAEGRQWSLFLCSLVGSQHVLRGRFCASFSLCRTVIAPTG